MIMKTISEPEVKYKKYKDSEYNEKSLWKMQEDIVT